MLVSASSSTPNTVTTTGGTAVEKIYLTVSTEIGGATLYFALDNYTDSVTATTPAPSLSWRLDGGAGGSAAMWWDRSGLHGLSRTVADSGDWTGTMVVGTVPAGSHTLSVSVAFNPKMPARSYDAYFSWTGLEVCAEQNIGPGDSTITQTASMNYAPASSPASGGGTTSTGAAPANSTPSRAAGASAQASPSLSPTSQSQSPSPSSASTAATAQAAQATPSVDTAQLADAHTTSSAGPGTLVTWFAVALGMALLVGGGVAVRRVRRHPATAQDPSAPPTETGDE